MEIRFPFRNLEPKFLSGLLDDPLLLIKVRPTGSHLLFDCGQLHHLAKRILTRIETVFISHCHMDHLLGIDLLIRHLHAAGKTVDLFGPPGLTAKIVHHFAGYDWNLAEEYWSNFRVHDIYPDQIKSSILRGPQQFQCEQLGSKNRQELTIYQTRHLQVEAQLCDHRVASLQFRINEQPAFLIDSEKLEANNLIPGPWIKELKRRFFQGDLEEAPLTIPTRSDGKTAERVVTKTQITELCQKIGKAQQLASIGYISDIGFTPNNRKIIERWLGNLELLVCETTFLAADLQKARNSFHLCTSDVNQLLAVLKPNWFLPMHLSKTYSKRCQEIYRELRPPPNSKILQIPAHTTARPKRLDEFSWQYELHES